ncbi:B3 domain-containing protein [Cardamine amara subsp. amara]|uniref:B3 domain-containing protein n=1 Tax=Cardamine amara subsp. amara TaxID=228776 RepID=A0ABD1AFZ0_CARAN
MSISDVSVSPAKKIRTNMSQEPRATTQASSVLPSKETGLRLFEAKISPAKKRERTSTSQAIQEETEMSISDVTIPPARKRARISTSQAIQEETEKSISDATLSMGNKRERTSSSQALQEYRFMDSEETKPPAKKIRTNMSQEPRVPSKKTEEFRLFGVSIPLSSAFSTTPDEELKKTNCLKDPEKVLISTTLCLYDETWPCGNPNYPNVNYAPRNEELTEQTRKIEEVKVDLARFRDSTDPWIIKKDLNKTEITCGLLYLSRSNVEQHILRYLSEDDQKKLRQGDRILVNVHDHETDSSHRVFLMRWISKQNYCLKGSWRHDFVRRRGLRAGDKIGLFWDRFRYQLQFRVLSLATAKAPAEEKKLLNQ